MIARALALIAVLATSGCHAFYLVRGTVTSCATRVPLAGAHVDLRYPGEHGVNESEANGEFSVAVNDPPNDREGTLTVTAPGHRPETRTVHHGDRVEVCLQDEAK